MNLIRTLLAGVALALVAVPAAAANCPRIVSQSPFVTYALEWMELADCIVGVSRYDRRDLPRTGGVMDPDGDMIALLDAELVITSDWTKPEVLQAVTPRGAKSLRVSGFESMAGVEAMLREIGRAANVPDIDARVDRFAADWKTAASQVGGKSQRVLLVSACTGTPYSFGRGTSLFELFTQAGFIVAETQEKIHRFPVAPPEKDLAHWVGEIKPDIVFAFSNRWDATCNAALAQSGVRVVPLDGELFYHPGPRYLEGLAQVREELK